MSEQAAIGNEFEAARARAGGDFSLGAALIQPALNRISIDGRVAQVEPKVMQVLTLMASRPGAVVSRQTFLETVWAGTVGDDYLLNRAVSELRKIFDDDPGAPRYIETIRKTGYRLVAPIAPARIAAVVRDGPPEGARAAPPAEPAVVAAPRLLPPPAALAGLAFAGLAVAAIVVAVLIGGRAREIAPEISFAGRYDIRPLTSYVGRELDPALSPDGSRVAFVWDGGGEGAFDVYVKAIGAETALNLTGSDGDERYPVWTPDGRSVLFARSGAGGTSIMSVSALGGGATRILTDPAAEEVRGLSLSPDGRTLAYARRERGADSYRVVLAALDDGNIEVLTNPPPGALGDIDPLFARDGRSVIFIRSVNEVTKDLYAASLDGAAPVRLTFDNRKISGLAWTPAGDRLLYGSTRSGMYRVWSVAPSGGAPELAGLGGEAVQQIATAPGAAEIVFEEWTHRAQIRRLDLAAGTNAATGGQVRSTRWDSHPSYAPDGGRIAFTSNRSGPPGIWVSGRDGRDAVEIAALDGAFVEHAVWSPDGATIAFDGSPEGRTSIFLVSSEGGSPRRFTDDSADSRNPAWSRDGARIYYESNIDGDWRIYARPVAGGAPVAITDGPALNPRESADGEWIYYSKPDLHGLWRRPAAGGAEDQVLADLEPQDGANWALASNGVYYLRRPAGAAPVLSFLDAASGQTGDVVTFSAGFEGWGFDLSPDENEIIYSELEIRESDLRLAAPRES